MTRTMLAAILSLCAAALTEAQQPGAIPVHPVGRTVATAAEHFSSVLGIRQLSDGRVLVNDGTARRLLLFDSALTKASVVLDSAAGTGKRYPGLGRLIAYSADTTLLLDTRSEGLLVIDPAGKIKRSEALPVPADFALVLLSVADLSTSVDPARRLLYQATMQVCGRPDDIVVGAVVGVGWPICPGAPDTLAPIVRAAWGSPTPDTVGYIRLPDYTVATPNTPGVPQRVLNPFPGGDEWVVTSDGWLALIRAHDYHVDWVGPDGSRVSSPKLPFDWHPVSDSEKTAFVDSVRASRRNRPAGPVAQEGGALLPSDLRDYRPPFRPSTARADAEGNVWILTTPYTPIAGGPIYDVVSRSRGLIDRVQLPKGMTIVGFGRGVVYLTSRQSGGTMLLRALVH